MAHPSVTPEDVALLKTAIGERHVSTGASNLDLHSKDESYHEPHRPDVVVWPQKTDDVAAVVQTARAAPLHAVPRGKRAGLLAFVKVNGLLQSLAVVEGGKRRGN